MHKSFCGWMHLFLVGTLGGDETGYNLEVLI